MVPTQVVELRLDLLLRRLGAAEVVVEDAGDAAHAAVRVEQLDLDRKRVTAQRMVGVPGDEVIRSDESGFPVNRAFARLNYDIYLAMQGPAGWSIACGRS